MEKTLSKVDLIYHLLNNGNVCYLPEKFNQDKLIDKLMEFQLEKLNLESRFSRLDNLHFIEYQNKSGIKNSLGLTMRFKIFFILDQQKIFFDIKPEKWFESSDKKLSLVNLVNQPLDKEIISHLFEIIYTQSSNNDQLKIDTRNQFIEKINEKKKIWFAVHSLPDEKLILFLEISAIKKDNGKLNRDKELSWFVFFSSHRAGLVGFDNRDVLVQQLEISPGQFRVKNEIGRNPVYLNDIKLLSTRSNADLFYHTQHIHCLELTDRFREIVRLNWLYMEKNEEGNHFAIDLQQFIVNQDHNPYDEFSLLYMQYTKGNRQTVFSEYAEDEKLDQLLQKILNDTDTYDMLTNWVQKWNISYIDSAILNHLFIKSAENAVQSNNILPFYRFVRENFHKKNQDRINAVFFDIAFSKHLIKCGLGKEATKILKKRLEELPDETISDILPPKNIDLTSHAAGQLLKVNILEILSGLQKEKESVATKIQIAQLQPLVEERMEKLVTVSEPVISAKGNELKEIMKPGGLSLAKTEVRNYTYKPLNPALIEKKLKHPASRKDGSFSNFQKWLATVKIPDLSVLKSYTEKLSSQKYPELSIIVADIKYALSLENLEVYISHGDKSVGITSFESNPQFLIVGGDHLDKNSPNYLNYSELRFAVGVELAHLYFKHARITSSDIWKGAFDKGYFVVDTILSIFPAVGMFSKSLQSIGRLNQIATFLQKTEKIGKISSKSRDIVKNSEQIINLYKTKILKEKKDEEKEMELLATSRIMQLTANRCGLVFCNDIKSAIRALFLVSKRYYTELPVVEKYGIKEYLLKTDEKGNYQHQEMAIRYADLFSFYLSDEYEQLTRELMKSKK